MEYEEDVGPMVTHEYTVHLIFFLFNAYQNDFKSPKIIFYPGDCTVSFSNLNYFLIYGKLDWCLKYLDCKKLYPQITNDGKWGVQNVTVYIDWPYEVQSPWPHGKWALYVMEMPTIITYDETGKMQDIRQCTTDFAEDRINPLNLKVGQEFLFHLLNYLSIYLLWVLFKFQNLSQSSCFSDAHFKSFWRVFKFQLRGGGGGIVKMDLLRLFGKFIMQLMYEEAA